MMKNFKNNFISKLKILGNAEFLNDDSTNKTKLPLWEISLLPIGILLYRFKRFLYLSFIYAFLISILAFVTKSSYVCGYTDWAEGFKLGCTKSSGLYITFFLIRLLIISVFLRMWYKSAVCGEYLNIKEMFVIRGQDWKIFASFMGVLGILCLPLISVSMMMGRVPNPDWRIESLFFAFVFVLACVPILLIRFWGVFSCSVSKQKHPSFRKIWHETSGQIVKIILSIFLMVILCMIIVMKYHSLSSLMVEHNFLLGSLISDFFYNILFLMSCCVMVANSFVLNSYLLSQSPDKPEEK